MHTFETKIQEIKTAVLTEVARLTWEDQLQTGILDIPTSDSLASFQQMSLIPATGELDKHTWKHLALHYPLATNSLKQQK